MSSGFLWVKNGQQLKFIIHSLELSMPEYVALFSVARQSNRDPGRLILKVSRSHPPSRTLLNEWSVRRRGRYLHNTFKHKRPTTMPSAGFEPAIRTFKRLQTARPPESARCVCLRAFCVCVLACVCVSRDASAEVRQTFLPQDELSAAAPNSALIFGTLNYGRNPNSKWFSMLSILIAVSIKSKQLLVDWMFVCYNGVASVSVGWRTAPQDGRLRVPFPVGFLEIWKWPISYVRIQ